jgi:lysozyme
MTDKVTRTCAPSLLKSGARTLVEHSSLGRPRAALSAFLAAVLITHLTSAPGQNELPREQRAPSGSLIEDLAGSLGMAPPSGVRPLKPLAPDLIMAFEGWEPSAYDDPSGYCTIGFGHLIKKAQCATLDLSGFRQPLARQSGAELLQSDTRTARVAIQEMVRVDLKDHEFGALTAFVFNVGKSNFAKSNLLKLLNSGAAEVAANEFGKWVVSNKKVLPGLVARRACEAAMFKGYVTSNADGQFSRASCETLGAAPSSSTLIDVVTGQKVSPGELQ